MLFSIHNVFTSILTTALIAFLLCRCAVRPCGILQQISYSNKKYFSWLNQKNNLYKTRISMLAFLSFLAYTVFALCFIFSGDFLSAFVALLPCIFFYYAFLRSEKRHALKVKTVISARIRRILSISFVLYWALAMALAFLMTYVAILVDRPVFYALRHVLLSLMPLLVPYVTPLAQSIGARYDVPHNKAYALRAQKVLAESDVIRVGITGSYGKTSVKNILQTMLSHKYRVLATPSSYNTPVGIAKCVLSSSLSDYDVFIAEMGARHEHDIDELCSLVSPDYGIITSVCEQHLETFGSIDVIRRTKGELLSSVKKTTVVPEKLLKTYTNATACLPFEIIEANSHGTSFYLEIKGVKAKLHTKLLGEGSAYNIALAATLAYEMGVAPEDILLSVAELEPTPHRLQPLVNRGMLILDDSYNSNPHGAESAIDVLKTAEGRKVIVTPGLIELGILSEPENEDLGKRLASLDLVFLLGDTLASVIKKGYLAAGGNPETLFMCPTLDKAKELLQKHLQMGDTVLFLNDLPDAY